MKRLKIWWYQRALNGASIELEDARLKMTEANSRLGFYKRKLAALRTGDQQS